jgi:hypothetical protein
MGHYCTERPVTRDQSAGCPRVVTVIRNRPIQEARVGAFGEEELDPTDRGPDPAARHLGSMTVHQTMADNFSVVIPTIGRCAELQTLVRHVQQLPGAPEEIVVVVDGDDPPTWEAVARLDPPVTLVGGPGRGPATARNLGASAASGDWLVFLDDDDLPGDRWMTELRAMVSTGPADYVSLGFLRSWNGEATPMVPSPLGPAFSDVTANFIGGTFAVRSELFAAVGGFLDALRCMEFTDLSLRLMDEITRRGHVVRSIDTTAITIYVRPPEDRASQQPEVLESSWRAVRSRNAELLALDRPFSANQSATVGVAWLRAGRRRRALGWLWDAVRTDPSRVHLGRLGLWALGPVGGWLRSRR